MTAPQLAPGKGPTGSQIAVACEATPASLLYRRIVASVEQQESKYAKRYIEEFPMTGVTPWE